MNVRTTDWTMPAAGEAIARTLAGWQQRYRAPWRAAQLAVGIAVTMAFVVISTAFAAFPDITWRDRWQFGIEILVGQTVAVGLQVVVLRLVALRSPAPRSLHVLRFVAMVLVGSAGRSSALLFDVPSLRLGIVESAATGLWSGLFESLLVATFLVYQNEGAARSEEASRRLQQLQREQRAARRRLVEAQLQALQARVDPQMFFDVLDNVQRLYATDAPRAEALLDELIVFLRAALPRLRTVSSTLAQELELAASYFRLQSLRGDAQAKVHISLPDTLAPRAFPAGVILPLLSEARTAAIEVHADPGAGRDIAVCLQGERAPAARALQQVRQTLTALYGSAATLECRETPANVETRITIAHAAP